MLSTRWSKKTKKQVSSRERHSAAKFAGGRCNRRQLIDDRRAYGGAAAPEQPGAVFALLTRTATTLTGQLGYFYAAVTN